jgi:hypothetical protein
VTSRRGPTSFGDVRSASHCPPPHCSLFGLDPSAESRLASYERVLGPDHPGTLTSHGNLAAAYQAASRPPNNEM